jgi:hypothetical protein
MSSILLRKLEQTPIDLGESAQELAHFEVVGGHGADLGRPVFAHVPSSGFLIHLGGEVVTPLRGGLVKGALEKVEGLVDLTLELFLAELEGVTLFAHMYVCVYIRIL